MELSNHDTSSDAAVDSLNKAFQPVDWPKNMAARGRGYFAVYGYSENFKNLLLRKYEAHFQNKLQKCSLDDPHQNSF